MKRLEYYTTALFFQILLCHALVFRAPLWFFDALRRGASLSLSLSLRLDNLYFRWFISSESIIVPRAFNQSSSPRLSILGPPRYIYICIPLMIPFIQRASVSILSSARFLPPLSPLNRFEMGEGGFSFANRRQCAQGAALHAFMFTRVVRRVEIPILLGLYSQCN